MAKSSSRTMADDNSAVRTYLQANHNATLNAVCIGLCSCENKAYAALADLPRTFVVFCDDRDTHRWSEIGLVDELAFLDPKHPKKKTLKGGLLQELKLWNFNRRLGPLAPGLQEAATVRDIVKYKPGLQDKRDAEEDMDENENMELVLRPQGVPELGPAATEAPIRLPGQPLVIAGGLAVGGGTAHEMVPTEQDQVRAAGLMHLLRSAAEHAPMLAADALILLNAWSTRDGRAVFGAAIAILPHYFLDMPAWLDQIATPGLAFVLHHAITHPVMEGAIASAHQILGLPESGALAIAPLNPSNVLFREGYAAAMGGGSC
ncbi:hypothetical protein LTR53_001010 [Teratosphaeriaceae sp. CCFEE 6253]|nr:hypothetical protein LTR53_001010 [Teratosphaeriaceae sp. CCFEE 6253]